MKKTAPLLLLLSLLIAGIALLSIPGNAEEGDYVAQMTGCSNCSSCKKRVVLALAKLEGVTSVRFLKEKENDLHKVIVGTNGNEISFDIAAGALEDLHHFELKSWGLLKKD